MQTDIAYSVIDPNAGVIPGQTSFPQPVAWPILSGNTTCNSYLPQDSTLNRFVWVVNYLARNGFIVIIDDHYEDPTVENSRDQFIANWVDLVTRLSSDPATKEHLIVDILNEPDSRRWGWDVMGVSKQVRQSQRGMHRLSSGRICDHSTCRPPTVLSMLCRTCTCQ